MCLLLKCSEESGRVGRGCSGKKASHALRLKWVMALLGLRYTFLLVAHRSPAAQARWETNAFLLWENKTQGYFSQSLFWSFAENKIIACFPCCPRLSVDLSLSSLRPCNREVMKKDRHFKEIIGPEFQKALSSLLINIPDEFLSFQRVGRVLLCQNTVSMSVIALSRRRRISEIWKNLYL